MKSNNKRTSGKTGAGAVEAGLPRRKKVGLVPAALWLQIIVAAFLAVQLSRVSTPMVAWLDKLMGLTVRQ